MDAFMIGIPIFVFTDLVSLPALIITLGVFLGLYLFMLESKHELSGICLWLFRGLIVLSKPQTRQRTKKPR
jgi:FtsH-binding integral membrane protein